MLSKSFRDTLVAYAVLLAAQAVAYGLDFMVFQLRQYANRQFDRLPILWIPTFANFVAAAGLVVLVWWLTTQVARNRWIGLGFLLLGVLVALYVPLLFTFGLSRFGVPAFDLLSIGNPVSYWNITGTVVAIAGALHLLRRRPVS